MSESNGTTVIPIENGKKPAEKLPEREPYRPSASTDKVRRSIESAFREIVSEATSQAGHFTYLAWVDREKGTAVQYGHVVDATECLEIAMTHLGLLKAALAYRLRIEDEDNSDGPSPF
ncbi:MAG: hypothetical protein ACRDRK_00735 [Pseudonocardia sp.]